MGDADTSPTPYQRERESYQNEDTMYIYILTNGVNGKQYVGQSIHDPLGSAGRVKEHLSLRYKGCHVLHNALLKYGVESFEVEVIPYLGASQEALNAIEQWYIVKEKTLTPDGYNISSGGKSGGTASLETRRKLSEAHRGKEKSVEHREKIGNAHKGKVLTSEHCRNISDSKKGKNHHFYGKKFSPEHCRNISEGQKGNEPWNKGKKMSEKYCQTMSENLKKSWRRRKSKLN